MVMRRQPALLAADEVNTLLQQGQSERLAFLGGRSTAKVVAETLVALANAGGGMLLLGVTPGGVPGRENDAGALRELVLDATLQSDPPLILPSPQVVDLGRGLLLATQVPPGLPHIYSLHGAYLTRTGGRNRPLATPELRRLLLDRGEAGYESQIVEGAGLDDLDPARVERYLERVLMGAPEDTVQALLARGCLSHDDEGQVGPTVAGILLFGRNPQRFLRSAEIICVRYAGTSMGDEFVRQDVGGALADQIRQAEAFVVGNMRRDMRIAGFAREDSSEYPVPVVREAIVNAVAHRDYSVRGEGIRLLMYSDRLEVYSPGRLPGHVTLENLKDERYSRNEAVVAVLSDIGYIERLGYGIDRMMAAMQEAGLPQPVFEETAAGFKVTLSAAPALSGAAAGGGRPDMTDGARLRASGLNERQERALAFVREHGRITNSDLQEMAPDVSPETIRRDLADLVEKNLLLRIGAKRATYYILK